MVEENDTIDFNIFGNRDGIDNGTRTKVNQRAGTETLLHQIEVDYSLSSDEYTEAIIIDGERRILLNDILEKPAVTMHYAYLIAEVYLLAQLCRMQCEDVTHS